jgi:hypothetical protein
LNLYPYYKQNALDTGNTDHADMNTDSIKVLLLESGGYTSTDKYVSDVLNTGTHTGVHECARSAALASPTVVNGTFDAADVTLTAVATGHTVDAIVVFKDAGGADTANPVIAFIDKAQDGTTALSQATNGGDITVQFHASGIFDL